MEELKENAVDNGVVAEDAMDLDQFGAIDHVPMQVQASNPINNNIVSRYAASKSTASNNIAIDLNLSDNSAPYDDTSELFNQPTRNPININQNKSVNVRTDVDTY